MTSGGAPSLVYESLRDLIVRGQLAPGSRIVEQDIAARLGVSRTPVRGALQRLQQEGFVAATASGDPGGAVRPIVTPLTRDDASELFRLLGALEALAARESAELPRDDRLRLADELKVLNAEFVRAAERRKGHSKHHESSFDADAAFHRRVVDASAGPRLRALHEVVHPQAERYERLYSATLMDAVRVVEEDHRAIVRAVREGDGADAHRAAVAHWRNAAERIRWAMETSGEWGNW